METRCYLSFQLLRSLDEEAKGLRLGAGETSSQLASE